MINTILSHYRITAKLGQGGMGEVYRATDTKLDREVAIKILPPEIADSPQRRKRFLRGAKAAAALNHPNVCTIYEVGETEGAQPFIAMEYLPGQTLESLAKQTDTELAGDTGATTEEQTEPGKVMGTPCYMSPEQARGETLDHRSDLFSLGIVLYQLTTSRLPFKGSSFAETVEKITRAQPEAIARFNYEISSELDRIIRKCLEKKPEEGYQSARELLIDLQRLKRDTVSGRSSVTANIADALPPPWWRGKVALGTAGLVLLVLLAGGGWYFKRARTVGEAIRSVAGLPFINASGDPNREFFSDGITESLINSLSQLPNLDVKSWDSSFRYKGKNTDALSMRGYAYAVAGRTADARRVIDQLDAISKQGYIPPTTIAMIYLALGEKDQAFEWLEKAREDKSILSVGVFAYVKLRPAFDPLRSDPRFTDLLRRMNLQPEGYQNHHNHDLRSGLEQIHSGEARHQRDADRARQRSRPLQVRTASF